MAEYSISSQVMKQTDLTSIHPSARLSVTVSDGPQETRFGEKSWNVFMRRNKKKLSVCTELCGEIGGEIGQKTGIFDYLKGTVDIDSPFLSTKISQIILRTKFEYKFWFFMKSEHKKPFFIVQNMSTDEQK